MELQQSCRQNFPRKCLPKLVHFREVFSFCFDLFGRSRGWLDSNFLSLQPKRSGLGWHGFSLTFFVSIQVKCPTFGEKKILEDVADQSNSLQIQSALDVPGSSSRDLVRTHFCDLFKAENVTSIWGIKGSRLGKGWYTLGLPPTQ